MASSALLAVTPIMASGPRRRRAVAKSVIALDGRHGFFTATRRTDIILANMYAFTAYCEGNVHSIVYQQGNAVFLRDCVEFLGNTDQFASFTCLVTKLDDRDA